MYMMDSRIKISKPMIEHAPQSKFAVFNFSHGEKGCQKVRNDNLQNL